MKRSRCLLLLLALAPNAGASQVVQSEPATGAEEVAKPEPEPAQDTPPALPPLPELPEPEPDLELEPATPTEEANESPPATEVEPVVPPEAPAELAPISAPGSPPADAVLPRSLGSTFDRAFLEDLPGRGLWSLFETVESTAILDRIDGGGLYVGEAGLLGIRGSSWTQASWTLGDLDITDPHRTGTPLFFADPESVEAVEIAAGLSPADHRGLGPGINLILRRPGASWRRSLFLTQAPSALQQTRGAGIARLDSFGSGGFRLDGPLVEGRLGLLVSGTFARATRYERSDPEPLSGGECGLLAHVVYTPTPRDDFRFVAGLQGVTHAFEGRARYSGADVRQTNRFFQLQSSWQRQGRRPWSASAGFVRGSFNSHLPGIPRGVVERTEDGPVQMLFPGDGTRGRFSLSGFTDLLTNAHHALRVGAELSLTWSSTRPAGWPGFMTPEKVGGLPARVWDYGWGGPISKWRGNEVSLYATDQVRYGRLLLDAGLRLESSGGSVANSSNGIRWSGLSSRLVARFLPFGGRGLTLLSGYAWYDGRLPLGLLAYGDPAAPHGQVYRWRDDNGDGLFQAEEQGELISRVGPGGPWTSIDPDLQAPRSRDVFFGFESQAGSWEFRVLAYHRRERNLVTSVNVGVPASAYDVYFVPDPGNDIAGSGDDYLLPIYNRRPESFGEDRYLLTNDPEKGQNKGIEVLIGRNIGKRFRLIAGGTASKSLAPAAYRGFRAIENDQGLVGERTELPNATTWSRGRLFFERGYNLKAAATYSAPRDIQIGVVGRYQDGQHFARFVIPEDLSQGPEPVRGITNGESRFTFVLTIDVRVEKGFSLGRRRLAAVAEAFNLPGSSIEVEQYVIWGPNYRDSSAVQPPRVVRLGLRLDF